jgi:hypothetical protein
MTISDRRIAGGIVSWPFLYKVDLKFPLNVIM